MSGHVGAEEWIASATRLSVPQFMGPIISRAVLLHATRQPLSGAADIRGTRLPKPQNRSSKVSGPPAQSCRGLAAAARLGVAGGNLRVRRLWRDLHWSLVIECAARKDSRRPPPEPDAGRESGIRSILSIRQGGACRQFVCGIWFGSPQS